MGRYQTNRNNIQTELTRKVFVPLARMRGYTMPTEAEVAHRVHTRSDQRRLILPKFFWQKANLLSNQQIMQLAIQLWEKKGIPFRTIADMFGWELDAIKDGLKQEESTPLDSDWREAKKKYLADHKSATRDLLDGKKMDEILKKEYKDQITAPPESKEEEKKGSEKKPGSAFVPPSVELPTPSAGPELTPRPEGPPPLMAPPAPPGGAATERAPRPAEGMGLPPIPTGA